MKLNESQLRNLQFATEKLCIEQNKDTRRLGLWQVVRTPLFYFNEEKQTSELTGVECYRDVSQLAIISAICLLGERSLVTIDLTGMGMSPAERLLFLGYSNFILDLNDGTSIALENGHQTEGGWPTRRHFICNCRVPHLFLTLDDAFLGLRAGPNPPLEPPVSGLVPGCRISAAQIHFEIEGANHVLVAAELVRYARALLTVASSAVSQAIETWNLPGTSGFDVEDEDLAALFEHAQNHPFKHGNVLFHCEA